MRTYRACAALLSYPEADLLAALPELLAVLDGEPTLSDALRVELSGLFTEFGREPLTRLQENYVALFDRSRALSLHLFEHVHGESRDRGQAMVDLLAAYRARGVTTAGNELPDYLPAFLEYLSLLPEPEARELAAEASGVLRALGERLAERGSRYAAVFAALLELAGEPGLAVRRAGRPTPGAEDSPEALDRAWREEPVVFGGAGAGSGVSLRDAREGGGS